MTSSKGHMPTVLAVSLFRGRPSTQVDKAHLPWTIYLQPFDFGVMCTVSACSLWKMDGVCITVGGISTTRLVHSWQWRHVLTYQCTSHSISGHQKRSINIFCVVYAPLWPIVSCTDLIIYIRWVLSTTSLCLESMFRLYNLSALSRILILLKP